MITFLNGQEVTKLAHGHHLKDRSSRIEKPWKVVTVKFQRDLAMALFPDQSIGVGTESDQQ